VVKAKLNGRGTKFEPYIVSDIDDLIYISKKPILWNNRYFSLVSNIDANAHNFTPIGWESIPFNGVFEGNGYNIKNLTVDLPEIHGVGLFGHIDIDAKIKSVIIDNANIIGKDGCGGIVGCNEGGYIKCCKVKSATIKVLKDTDEIAIGICVGANYNNGLVRNCSGKATVITFNRKYEYYEKRDIVGYNFNSELTKKIESVSQIV
jgi:hypothetical protein